MQAFLQLGLHRWDRALTMFLWYRIIKYEDLNYDNSREIITCRFTRLPFLLSATIRERSDRYKAKFPTAAALVDDITFMDDLAAGEENNVCVTHNYYEFVNF